MTERGEIFKALEDIYRKWQQEKSEDDLRAELARVTTDLMQHLTVRDLSELLEAEQAAEQKHLLEDVRMYAWNVAKAVGVQASAELTKDGEIIVRLWSEIDQHMHRATVVIDWDGTVHATYHIDGIQEAERDGTDWRGLVIAACRWLEANRHKSVVIRLGRIEATHGQ